MQLPGYINHFFRVAVNREQLRSLPTSRLLDNLPGSGLANQLVVRITYGMAIYQRLSAPASLRDNFRVADNSAAIGLLSVEIW